MISKNWAIVLAAGESKRMGRPKMLLPFGEKTIIENVIDAIFESRIENILIVLGSNRESIEQKVSSYPLKTVFNPDYKSGMLSSVQTGFRALPRDAQVALVFLGDQPSISPAVIGRVCAAFAASEKSIAVPVFKERRGHPVAIAAEYRDEIQTLRPDIGLRQLLHTHPDEIFEVLIEQEEILEDIDNLQDYAAAIKTRKKRLKT
jgi:molybdenum cofactor cytidylyltransferase